MNITEVKEYTAVRYEHNRSVHSSTSNMTALVKEYPVVRSEQTEVKEYTAVRSEHTRGERVDSSTICL